MKTVLAIHGGAGSINPSEYPKEKLHNYYNTLRKSLLAGHRILQNGGTSFDAVICSIKILEDCPLFNAGKGAVFNQNALVELDASIMEGKSLKAGAATCLHKIKNPILLAAKILQYSPHVMLSGDGAELFAYNQGIELVENTYFHTQEKLAQLHKSLHSSMGTVGAVALDSAGNLAAGTSTGGLTNKLYGRVSDSSLIGAGNYANNKTCAISGTGTGDPFIRSVLAHDFSCLIEYKSISLKLAAQTVLKKIQDMGGQGGLIAIDNSGDICMDFNSSGMFRGYIKNNQIFYGAFAQIIKGEF